MAKKSESITSQMLKEKQAHIKAYKSLKSEASKGVSVRLSIDDHLLLRQITSEFDEKVGRFASEMLSRGLHSMAIEMNLGEYNFDTGEFEIYDKDDSRKSEVSQYYAHKEFERKAKAEYHEHHEKEEK